MTADSLMPVVMSGRGVLIGEVSLALCSWGGCCLAENPIRESENFGERYTDGQQTADSAPVVVELRRHQPLLARSYPWRRNLIRNSNSHLTAELLASARLASRLFHKR